MHRIAFVVPTKDRPDDLRRMLASLRAQTRMPDQVIVVDGSEASIRDIVDACAVQGIEYERVFPPSLAQQRNAGMRKLAPHITVAGYLDDDVVLEPDAVARMLAFWETAGSDVGGAAFNIVNSPAPGVLGLKEFFAIDSPEPGRVLASGCASSIPAQPRQIETEWLFGGATLWRRRVIEEFAYDEWFVGTGFMEDVDYSFSVGGRYKLFLVADARLVHHSRPVRPDRQYLLGWWQVVNRMYFVTKHRHRGLSVPRAWWATFGLVVLNILAAVARRNVQHWNRARGNIGGMLSVLSGRKARVGGHLK